MDDIPRPEDDAGRLANRLFRAKAVLWEAREKLLDDDPALANDEAYLSEILSSDPTTCTAWELLGQVMRASVAARATAEIAERMAEGVIRRRDRYLRRAASLKAAAAQCLREMGQSKAAFPDVSLTIETPRMRIRIVDEDAIPDEFRVTVSAVSKAAVQQALESGRDVQGAVRELGEPVVKIRAI